MDSLISAIVEMAEGREMRLFHQTKTQDAQSIWKDGFQDIEVIEDDGCAGEKFAGVRLLDRSIGWNPNPDGDNLLLVIEIPADVINNIEWRPERQHHWLVGMETREFLVPASLVNQYGPPVVEAVDSLGSILGDIDLSGI